MTGPTPLIDAKHLALKFGTTTALHDVSLRIFPGESVALIGGNGSGKSSLLRLLHGLIKPSGGRLTVAPGKSQAMVFQKPYMLRASGQTNVAVGLWLAGRSWVQARRDALQALQRVGLGDQALRNGKTLSGGQQQRLALARAWALRPDLLFLDEPTASLDPHAKREVETLIAGFVPRTTLVFASHNLGQVKRLASRVVYLEEGRIMADLSTERFFDGPWLALHFPAAQAFVKG